ncbi:MAG TPA: NAD(P)-dependent oxidoreductase [Candidatus Sulfotelmatobacter sp.]|nr:NAD(P)-dependent oxidoreductase [Candidatus Sulfotelmatobacter sp.]
MTTHHLRVGIVGLGDMGAGMAERLLDAGFPLTGWNRTRAKAERFATRGMAVAGSPREVAERSDLIISMVTDNAALNAVLDGEDGILAGLQKGAIFAEMSTTSPTLVRAVAQRVAERGAHLLDAPVLGSILTLRQGNLLVMVGGPQASYARAEPAFQAIGSTVRHVGEVGQAKALKLAANLNLAVQVVAMSEGVVLAEKMGIDRRLALETLLGGVIASPALKYRMPFALEPPDYAWFDVTMIQKDLQLALDLAHEIGVPLGTGASAQQSFTAARGFGYAKEDFAVVLHAVAAEAGIARDPKTVPPYSGAH